MSATPATLELERLRGHLLQSLSRLVSFEQLCDLPDVRAAVAKAWGAPLADRKKVSGKRLLKHFKVNRFEAETIDATISTLQRLQQVAASRAGTPAEIAVCFVALARHFGGEARLVSAFSDGPSLTSSKQQTGFFEAARADRPSRPPSELEQMTQHLMSMGIEGDVAERALRETVNEGGRMDVHRALGIVNEYSHLRGQSRAPEPPRQSNSREQGSNEVTVWPEVYDVANAEWRAVDLLSKRLYRHPCGLWPHRSTNMLWICAAKANEIADITIKYWPTVIPLWDQRGVHDAHFRSWWKEKLKNVRRSSRRQKPAQLPTVSPPQQPPSSSASASTDVHQEGLTESTQSAEASSLQYSCPSEKADSLASDARTVQRDLQPAASTVRVTPFDSSRRLPADSSRLPDDSSRLTGGASEASPESPVATVDWFRDDAGHQHVLKRNLAIRRSKLAEKARLRRLMMISPEPARRAGACQADAASETVETRADGRHSDAGGCAPQPEGVPRKRSRSRSRTSPRAEDFPGHRSHLGWTYNACPPPHLSRSKVDESEAEAVEGPQDATGGAASHSTCTGAKSPLRGRSPPSSDVVQDPAVDSSASQAPDHNNCSATCTTEAASEGPLLNSRQDPAKQPLEPQDPENQPLECEEAMGSACSNQPAEASDLKQLEQGTADQQGSHCTAAAEAQAETTTSSLENHVENDTLLLLLTLAGDGMIDSVSAGACHTAQLLTAQQQADDATSLVPCQRDAACADSQKLPEAGASTPDQAHELRQVKKRRIVRVADLQHCPVPGAEQHGDDHLTAHCEADRIATEQQADDTTSLVPCQRDAACADSEKLPDAGASTPDQVHELRQPKRRRIVRAADLQHRAIPGAEQHGDDHLAGDCEADRIAAGQQEKIQELQEIQKMLQRRAAAIAAAGKTTPASAAKGQAETTTSSLEHHVESHALASDGIIDSVSAGACHTAQLLTAPQQADDPTSLVPCQRDAACADSEKLPDAGASTPDQAQELRQVKKRRIVRVADLQHCPVPGAEQHGDDHLTGDCEADRIAAEQQEKIQELQEIQKMLQRKALAAEGKTTPASAHSVKPKAGAVPACDDQPQETSWLFAKRTRKPRRTYEERLSRLLAELPGQVAAVTEFKASHGWSPWWKSTDPIEGYLGRWVRTVRAAYAVQALPPEEKAMVESIPKWSWEPNNPPKESKAQEAPAPTDWRSGQEQRAAARELERKQGLIERCANTVIIEISITLNKESEKEERRKMLREWQLKYHPDKNLDAHPDRQQAILRIFRYVQNHWNREFRNG
eukprot:TRINITY_DN7377_c0_g1_i1.p1 TRINITY_DN7377_c0_g1~~TRINITY_DN7377_c0_g1_i1.p1  ORF type:complete len:1293 (-),score=183.89 TRINITY_DN7377_c0_g1_i1:362-4240(-)